MASKHTTQNFINIWEEAVDNNTLPSLLQLPLTTITNICHKIAYEVPKAK